MAQQKLNSNPNARYDHGPNAAGSGRGAPASVLAIAPSGLATDGTLVDVARVGFSAAGVSRNNGGPNVAGAQRSYNNK